MTRRFLLLRHKSPSFEILKTVGLESSEHDPLVSELNSYLERNHKYVRNKGLMFSHTLDTYFYVQRPTSDPSLYILSSHNISSCMSFYYNFTNINDAFEKHFGQTPENLLANPEVLLSSWGTEFESFTPEIEQNPYTNTFDNIALNWVLDNFGSKLGEFLYAILMKIPIFITATKDPESIASIFKQLVSHLNVHIGDQPAEAFHNIQIVTNLDLDQYKELIHLDTESNSVTIRFENPFQDGMKDLVEEAKEFHELNVMSFDVGIYNHLFWYIQKIYGVMIMNKGPVDFENYLHEEKIHFRDVLMLMFENISLLDNMYV